MTDTMTARVFEALDRFRIELPSWGFADTGTRFGVFRQPAAAVTMLTGGRSVMGPVWPRTKQMASADRSVAVNARQTPPGAA